MSATVNISSLSQWRQVLSSSGLVIADFYADWCGPCKVIAPAFESLSAKYSKPRKITFCKVNVDHHQDVAQQYGVSAMPTFLILHNGSVIQTVRGANHSALTSAVDKAAKLAGTLTNQVFGSPGQRLGGSGVAELRSTPLVSRPMNWNLKGIISSTITFFGLYFVSLISFDPYKAAEHSQFNKKNPSPPRPTPQKTIGSAGQRRGPLFKSMADLGN